MQRFTRTIAASAALVVLTASNAEAVSIASKTKVKATAACSCDCCETTMRQQGASDGSVTMFEVPQCSYREPGLLGSFATAPACTNTCLKSEKDQIMTSAKTQEVDMTRFCFLECAPQPKFAGEVPQSGDICSPLTAKEAADAKDNTGNGRELPREEVEVPKSSLFEENLPQPSQVVTVNLNLRKAKPEPAEKSSGDSKKWASVETDPSKMEALAKSVNDKAMQAQKAADKVQAMALKGASTLPNALGAVEDARLAARFAVSTQEEIHKVLETARMQAVFTAQGMIPQVVGPIKAKAHLAAQGAAAAKALVESKAAALKAGSAALDAQNKWNTAMAGAVKTRDEWAARGDNLASASASTEQQAQELKQEAQQWGEHADPASKYQEQKLIGMSNGLFASAQDLDKQAKAAFAKSKEIDESLPAYSRQANAASEYEMSQLYSGAQAAMPYVGQTSS